MRFHAALSFFMFATAAHVSAQQNIDTGCPVRQRIQPDGSMHFVDCKGRTATQAVSTGQPIEAIRPSPTPDVSRLPADSPGAVAYQKYLVAYYDYEAHSLAYAQSVFDWQYKSSIAIFVVVILLVVAGLAFAGIQFAIAMKAHPTSIAKKKEATVADQAGATSALASTFEASAHGVKITSSVVGLLILVVSIGFFYLYLVYVYPIQNIAK